MTKLLKIIGFIMLLIFVVLSGGMSDLNASEFNSILKGEYEFSSQKTCVQGAPGDSFNSDLSINANAAILIIYKQGTFTFNGDGTGSSTFTYLVIIPTSTSAGQYPADYGIGSGTLTYNVDQDKTFNVETVEATTETIVGRLPGSTRTYNGNTWDGRIEHGNNMIFGGNAQPNIEFAIPDVGSTRERICGSSITAMKKKMPE